jgi:hypothetical protein
MVLLPAPETPITYSTEGRRDGALSDDMFGFGEEEAAQPSSA